MNYQESRIRTKIIDVNNNEHLFYPYSINVNKCGGSCSNIFDPSAKLCIPNVVKNINYSVFNIISRSNETRLIDWLHKKILRLSH